jgi:hypothetical protein
MNKNYNETQLQHPLKILFVYSKSEYTILRACRKESRNLIEVFKKFSFIRWDREKKLYHWGWGEGESNKPRSVFRPCSRVLSGGYNSVILVRIILKRNDKQSTQIYTEFTIKWTDRYLSSSGESNKPRSESNVRIMTSLLFVFFILV